jgi:hypothetical protein
MAFSRYKEIGQVQEEYGIRREQRDFIPAETVEPAETFVHEFNLTLEIIPVFSEGSRTQTVIAPILLEVYKSYYQSVTLWIERTLIYDHKLSGTPDYILATNSPLGKSVFTKPLVAMMEAKKNDFDYGWAQCLAELVAAQKINSDDTFTVYGIVTDGIGWQFGKLEKDLFTQNILPYATADLPRLFGALHYVFRTIQTALATSPLRP